MIELDNGKKLPQLCIEGVCTGCGACAQSCARKAIGMTADAKGFLYPIVDDDVCVGCGLCERVCPLLHERKVENDEPEVYACWHLDEDVRHRSSSGGAFSAMASAVLQEGGVVWGAAFDEQLRLTYQCAASEAELDKLRRSKYIQAEVGDAFQRVKEQLAEGRKVLFVGTSCHVRGLLSFVPNNLKENLLTADFICHGVPSPAVFERYVEWIEEKYGDRLVDFRFRDKRIGCDYSLMTFGRFETIGERKLMNEENSFLYGMLHSVFLRPCCHACQSNGLVRESDFTIGDFWGIGRKEKFAHESTKHRGVSLLALNSNKARAYFKDIMSKSLYAEKRAFEEAYTGNSNYRYSCKPNVQSNSFWLTFVEGVSWADLLCYLKPSFSERCKQFLKLYFGPRLSNVIRKLMGK